MQHTNRLARETSPYLLQHAHNPVDWYPWGDEALQRARTENKPVLVSIGYAACHWCHVMERESFENEDTARFMNDHFINIKIDREERPDLDHIYMDAVQAITGSGGWPLNVFLTPEGRPFYGGTYFPPRPIHNRSSWTDVLAAISASFREKRDQIEQQAQSLTRHVAGANSFGIDAAPGTAAFANAPDSGIFNTDTLRQIYEHLMATADKRQGGFGGAPKFPQTFSIQYLLHYYHFTREEPALQQACLSLDKMIAGGIYDQIGGGFARYSTDNEWLAPHFEKMLYDNALLVIVLSEAWQLTKKETYREVIQQTMDFIHRELSDGQGGFYAALDADSEGEEGKYYVWDKAEIEAVLGEDAALFCSCYGVTQEGNWEGKNILIRTFPAAGSDSAHSSGEMQLPPAESEKLANARSRLLEYRSRRIRPALDDKILLGWNALMNIACSKAYGALGIEEYKDRAIANMNYCWERLKGKELYFFYHSYKAGQAKYPAFLDDYAGVIAALLQLQEITGDASYLLKAKEVMEFVLQNFSEEGTGFFFFTHRDQKDLILRKKEIYDGAVPSGNSVMAFNLAYMSIIFNEPDWMARATHMAASLQRPVTSYPGSFGVWATLYQAITYIIPEIVLTGKRPENARKELLQQLIPYRVFQSAKEENTHFPLLSDRPVEDSPLIFLCKNYACQLPVNEVNTLIRLLENVQKFSG
ncbi:MAG TPA: thioredoxin domain-containing protein [Puia sp.]|nr:thioredoxin domain-containing protein [Puia sp.]